MGLPIGKIVHFTSGRIRIRMPEKKNDQGFFESLEKSLKKIPEMKTIRSNPITASLLVEGDFTDARQVTDLLESKKLFQLDIPKADGTPLRQKVYQAFTASNKFAKERSRGELDLPILIFLMLVGTGIYQLMRSEVKLPPWYTAFWYALGIFTKSLMDIDAIDDNGGE
ncbi:MAG: HMA2 domain-containing protein [Desulfobacterales bacterium]